MPRVTNLRMDWDLSGYFTEFNNEAYRLCKTRLAETLETLQEMPARLAPLQAEHLSAWVDLLLTYQDAYARYGHLSSYVGCLVAADAKHPEYKREEAAVASLGAELEKATVALKLELVEADEEWLERLWASERVQPIAYYFQRLVHDARYRMSQPEETLAADLGVDGLQAWSRLYGNLAGSLEFTMTWPDGTTQRVPMSQRNSLLARPERDVRAAAFTGANQAWAGVETICAAALNAMAGTRLTLVKRRGQPSFLTNSLAQSRIRQETLDALLQAIRETLELPKAIMSWRARKMGRAGIAFYDLSAPIPVDGLTPIDWDRAVAITRESFHQAYPDLGRYFDDFLDRRWIDYTPRSGKRPGGFCTGSDYSNEQRIFMTYQSTLTDLMTLAHEVGHAWHSHVLEKVPPLARQYPMTLAETASTFAEALLSHGVVHSESMGKAEKIALLDAELRHATIFLLDIPVRFQFEKRFYEERQSGELSPAQIKNLMVETQQAHFGEVLLPGGEDPYFWASKLHFYIGEVEFYNFPYTFGYLLSASLFVRFREEGASFLPAYEDFLMRTGSMDSEEVVRQSLGEDITDPAFWRRAILGMENSFAGLRRQFGE